MPRLVVRRARIRWYRVLSNNPGPFVRSQVVTPVLALGAGTISAEGVQLGVIPTVHAFDGCVHLEARHDSAIRIGRGSVLGNACVLIAEGPGITVGENCLLGPEVMILDSDFHALAPGQRITGRPAMGPVRIGSNVFIGARAVILKGVTIGDGSVIAAASVVTSDVPPNTIAAGNPHRLVGSVP